MRVKGLLVVEGDWRRGVREGETKMSGERDDEE